MKERWGWLLGGSAMYVAEYMEIKFREFCIWKCLYSISIFDGYSAGYRILDWKFFLRIVKSLLYFLFTPSVILETFNAILTSVFWYGTRVFSGSVLKFLFIHEFLKFHENVLWCKSFIIPCAGHPISPSSLRTYPSKFWEIFLYCFFEKKKNPPLLSLYFLPGIVWMLDFLYYSSSFL